MQSRMDTRSLVDNDMDGCILKKLEIGNSFGNLPLGAEVGMMDIMDLKPRNGVRQIFGLPNLPSVKSKSQFKCFPMMMELTMSRNSSKSEGMWHWDRL